METEADTPQRLVLNESPKVPDFMGPPLASGNLVGGVYASSAGHWIIVDWPNGKDDLVAGYGPRRWGAVRRLLRRRNLQRDAPATVSEDVSLPDPSLLEYPCHPHTIDVAKCARVRIYNVDQ